MAESNKTEEDYEKSAAAPLKVTEAWNSKTPSINLTKEELIEESWNFLNTITEIVEKLRLHEKLLVIGRVMAKAGMIYIHTINKMHILRNMAEQERNKAVKSKQQEQ